jgi:hypothetical protein
MITAPTRTQVLAAMERDVTEAMRRHLPAYFAAGAPTADRFMAELARPLYGALYACGLGQLRDEEGATLDPVALHGLAGAAFEVRAEDAMRASLRGATNRTPEPAR